MNVLCGSTDGDSDGEFLNRQQMPYPLLRWALASASESISMFLPSNTRKGLMSYCSSYSKINDYLQLYMLEKPPQLIVLTEIK